MKKPPMKRRLRSKPKEVFKEVPPPHVTLPELEDLEPMQLEPPPSRIFRSLLFLFIVIVLVLGALWFIPA